MGDDPCTTCEQPVSLAGFMEEKLQRYASQVVSVARCTGCQRALWYRSRAGTSTFMRDDNYYGRKHADK